MLAPGRSGRTEALDNSGGHVEIGWDLISFSAALQCLHLDKALLEQTNTKKLYGTKNDCVHAQSGQIPAPKDRKSSNNSTATFEESGAKAGY